MADIDPNVGTREWDAFVKLDANGAPLEISYAPLTYKTSTNERPTDEWLVQDGYVGYIDPGKPLHNRFTHKVTAKPLYSLPIVNNVITQEYEIDTIEGADLEIATEQFSKAVNNEREHRISLGCLITVDGVGAIPIRGEPEDMRNLTNLGQVANMSLFTGVTTPIAFRDNDNVMHMLTPMQMSQLWQKAVMYVGMVYQASWALKEIRPFPASVSDNAYWPSKSI